MSSWSRYPLCLNTESVISSISCVIPNVKTWSISTDQSDFIHIFESVGKSFTIKWSGVFSWTYRQVTVLLLCENMGWGCAIWTILCLKILMISSLCCVVYPINNSIYDLELPAVSMWILFLVTGSIVKTCPTRNAPNRSIVARQYSKAGKGAYGGCKQYTTSLCRESILSLTKFLANLFNSFLSGNLFAVLNRVLEG